MAEQRQNKDKNKNKNKNKLESKIRHKDKLLFCSICRKTKTMKKTIVSCDILETNLFIR